MALLSILCFAHDCTLALASTHITENTYARVKTPISLMLRPTLLWRMEAWLEVSLVLLSLSSTLIIINAYMRAGVKMKEGDDENWETEIFYREIKMKKAKCFCKFEKPGILLTWPNYLYFPFFLFSKKSLKNSSKLPLPTLLLVLPLIISNAPAAIRAEPRG